MEQSKISEALQLQLEEAVVAVFMEQYAQYTDGDQPVEDTMDFPAELEERCRKVINRARAKRSGKKILRGCLRVGSRAAIVALVLLLTGTTLFFSVESFRIKLMNRYIEHKNGFVEISPRGSIKVGCNVDLDDPLRLVLEPDFELTFINNIGGTTAQYDTPDERCVVFHISDSHGVLQIDTEDSSVTQFLSRGYEILWAVKEKDNRHIFVWVDEQRGRIYQLTMWNIEESEAICICSDTVMLYDESD